MPEAFDAVKRQSSGVALQAASALRRRIERGELAPGDRLPPERTLLRQLGISRPALREALAMLEANGLLEAHVGRGRFVCEPPDDHASLSLVKNWLRAHRGEIADLNEIRCAVEPAAVRGSAADAWPKVLIELDELLFRADRALQRGDAEALAQLDSRFHKSLIGASQNRPLVALATGLIDLAEHTGEAVYAVPEAAEISLREHRALFVLASEQRYEEAAEALARHHHDAYLRAMGEITTSGDPSAANPQ
jgi:GntR family transcriptional repressor for pyruvate dehydrogenase complex